METTQPTTPIRITVQEFKAQEWNQQYPRGTLVRRYKALYPRREPAETHLTAGPAYVIGGHTAVVQLEGFSGCVNLEALEVLEVPKKEPAKEAPKIGTMGPKAPAPNLPKIPA